MFSNIANSSSTTITTPPSLHPLAACIALIFGSSLQWAAARPPEPAVPARVATTLPVTTCDDDGSPGSLRSVLASAISGDTVDLTQLACNDLGVYDGLGSMLTSATNVGLVGRNQTIFGNVNARVLTHTGVGHLTIANLNFTYGLYQDAGGCLYSKGSITLTGVHVFGCSGADKGGGVFAQYDLTLNNSSITGSGVGQHTGMAAGGAAYVGRNLSLVNSTISGNTATSVPGIPGIGGAFVVRGHVSVVTSTISGNVAGISGAIDASGTYWGIYDSYAKFLISNSTISGNTAAITGGIRLGHGRVFIDDSTIAFNQSTTAGGSSCRQTGGLCMYGLDANTKASIINSIIANNANTADSSAVADVYAHYFAITGRNNLIISSNANAALPDTLHVDPQLVPLANNGGPTRTHALPRVSPAVDAGNAEGWIVDQRGFPRVAGVAADIGAYELQQESIFTNGFD